jgi:hypothetical protein
MRRVTTVLAIALLAGTVTACSEMLAAGAGAGAGYVVGSETEEDDDD